MHLRDPDGKDHLVLADMGCRNTVFNAVAQSGLRAWKELSAAGYGSFRIELVDEPAASVAPLLESYRATLEGRKTVRDAWTFLETMPDANGRRHGVGEGSLAVAAERERADMKQTAYQSKSNQAAYYH